MRSHRATGARAGRSSASWSSKSVMVHISQLLLERGQAAVVAMLEGLLGDAGDGRRLRDREVAPDLEDDGLAFLRRQPQQDFLDLSAPLGQLGALPRVFARLFEERGNRA